MKRHDGFVMVVALLIMVAVTILVFGATFTTMIDRQVSSNQQGANESYYIAQAGLNKYKTLIFKNLSDFFAAEQEGWCSNPLGGLIQDGNGTTLLTDGDTTAPEAFGRGSYEVTFQLRDTYMILTSVGRLGNSQTTLQLVTTAGAGPAGSWDNAIMASGTTPGAKAINGNVSVYGSVHIVSGDLQIDNSAYSVSGTAGVYNNYYGEGSGSNDVRTPLGAITGSTDVDLCTRLKVKSGSIYLESGSNVLGAPGTDNAIHSIHLGNGRVYDGKPDRNPQLMEDHADPNEDPHNLVNLKFPVSGMNSGYEGYDLALPVLKDTFPNDRPGFTISAAECPWLVAGSTVTLPPASSGSCGNADGSIEWHPDGYLIIGGNINTADLDVAVTTSIEYEGQGALRVGATSTDSNRNVDITGELTPRGGQYPGVNALAIETTGDITFEATGKNSPIAVMAFAAGNVTFVKQPLLIGAVIADTFDLGNQVPKVAYHPDVKEVAEHLCLIGSFCYKGEVPPNPGILSDISIERRDTAAID